MEPILAKLIGKGWGASGYYSEKVLRRDGALAFPKGTLMFWNHATRNELRERPEGNMSNLAAVLLTDPSYDEIGKDGPGLYALAKTFSDYASQIAEKGPFTGLSIFADGSREWGKAEGKDGYIVTEIKPSQINSVDIVTRAGANGRFLFESMSSPEGFDLLKEAVLVKEAGRRDKKMGDDTQERLKEALTENAELKKEAEHLEKLNAELREGIHRLQEKNNKLEASLLIDEVMHEEYDQLSEATKHLITKMVISSLPVLDDGNLDSNSVRREVTKAVRPFLREGEKATSKRTTLSERLDGVRVYGQGSSTVNGGELLSEGKKALDFLSKHFEANYA